MDVAQKTNVAGNLKFEWNQAESEVTVVFAVGGNFDASNVIVKCDDDSCTLTLADGREWYRKLYQSVVGEVTQVKSKGNKLLLKLVKKVPNLHWQYLEAVEPKAQQLMGLTIESSEMLPFKLDHVKHDWYQKNGNLVTVIVYVKQINKASLQVELTPRSFTIKFQTNDHKFLSLHHMTNNETLFSWTLNLKNEIVMSDSRQSVSSTSLNLTLKKMDSQRWDNLEDLPIANHANVPTDKWMNIPSTAPPPPPPPPPPLQPPKPTTQTRPAADGDAKSMPSPAMDIPDVGRGAGDVDNMACLLKGVILDKTKKVDGSAAKKPMCMVSPLKTNHMEQVVKLGETGLDNLGNTCFMNSVIQCLTNTREFRDYFLDAHFQHDINMENPLGSGGRLAVAFAVLLKTLWSGSQRSCAPAKLKNLIAQKASQFMGFAQHDAQEFMAFLLDGLHEDLNRVKNKPYIENVDSDGRPDEVVADEAWNRYKMRNDSVVVDLFQGQYKSKLVCPACGMVSITFDPFLYLSVPLPKKHRTLPVIFFTQDPSSRPMKYFLKLAVESTTEDLKAEVKKITGVNPVNQRVLEVCNGKVLRCFVRGAFLSSITEGSTIFVFELLDERLAGESVLKLTIIQRLSMPPVITKCSSCKRERPLGVDKLKRCTKCYRAAYCNHSCQKDHWNQHKASCYIVPHIVGSPFVISLPRSQATLSKLRYLMESSARRFVDVFQPPVAPMVVGGVSVQHDSLGSQSSSSNSDLSFTAGGGGGGGSSVAMSSTSNQSGGGSNSSLSTSVTSVSSSSNATDEEGGRYKDAVVDDCAASKSVRNYCCLEKVDQAVASQGLNASNWLPSSQASPVHSIPTDSDDDSYDGLRKPVSAALQDASTSDSQSSQPLPSEPLTRVVFGQPHEEIGEKSVPLFAVKPVNLSGHNSVKEQLEDKGDEPLDLSDVNYLSMDWQNDEKKQHYVLVQSKELEYDLGDGDDSCCGEDSGEFNLKQCLHLFTEPEILSPEEAWYCPKCKQHREATKEMSVWRLPNILIVQLKRFSFKNIIWRDKIDKMVEFPTRDLDLSPYYCGPVRNTPPIYDLYAIINHQGSILGGHYTSLARLADMTNPRRSTIDWRLFDDSHVRFVSENQIVTKAAYVLFYRWRGSSAKLPSPRPPIASPEIDLEQEKQPQMATTNIRDDVDKSPSTNKTCVDDLNKSPAEVQL